LTMNLVPEGLLKSFLDPVRGKEFLQFVREADPFMMFDLSLDIFHSSRSLRNSN
jgi:hypothetical protein